MLNWAIIGSGDVVSRLVQDSFNVKNKSRVKYIYSKDINEAERLKKKFKFLKVAKNPRQIYDDTTVDGIYIATPPNSHLHYIRYFSKKIKNILCEKPVGINSYEIRQIKKIIKKNKNNFYIPFYRRFHERFLYVKNIIRKKSLGQPIFFKYICAHSPKDHPTHPISSFKKNKKIKIPWRFQKSISGGGNYIDMGLHALDLANLLLGNIESISANSSNIKKIYSADETVIANIKLKNNILGHGLWCSVINGKKKDAFEIYLTKGKITFSLNFSNRVILEKNNKKLIKNFELKKPVHKFFIHSMINQLVANRKFVDHEGIEINIKQFESLK